VNGKNLTEAVTVPKPLLKELYEHFSKIEEILATLEELMDEEGLKRMKKRGRKRGISIQREAILVGCLGKFRLARFCEL